MKSRFGAEPGVQRSRLREPIASGAAYSFTSACDWRTGAVVLCLTVMLAAAASGVHAQSTAQDTIDQGLLQRQQQLRDFENRLREEAQRASESVLGPLPADADSVSAPQPAPAQLAPAQLGPAPLPPAADLQWQQLNQSQQQQQLQQQTANQFLPAPLRQQEDQIQQLQFQRDDQAQQLEQQIQRDARQALPPR